MSTEKETLEFDLFFAGFLLQLNSYQRYLRSVHLFNGDYLSMPEGTGSCGYLFHEILGSWENAYGQGCSRNYSLREQIRGSHKEKNDNR